MLLLGAVAPPRARWIEKKGSPQVLELVAGNLAVAELFFSLLFYSSKKKQQPA